MSNFTTIPSRLRASAFAISSTILFNSHYVMGSIKTMFIVFMNFLGIVARTFFYIHPCPRNKFILV
jgi:hypothetical protein